MTRQGRLSPGDLVRLSAYMDRQLSPKQSMELEARLKVEPELARALRELENVVAAVGSLEPVRIPRTFTLTPEMAGGRRSSRRYPFLQLATAVSALAFVALIGIDLFGMRVLSGQMAAPANEQLFFESAPAMSDEIQEGEGVAQFAAGAPAADALLEEATPLPPAAMLGGGAPAEAEAADEAMKLSSTSLPTAAGEERAAIPEPETLEQPALQLGAAQPEPEADLPTPASTATEFRGAESAAPGLEPLRIGEILSGALALLLGLLLIFRHRRPA